MFNIVNGLFNKIPSALIVGSVIQNYQNPITLVAVPIFIHLANRASRNEYYKISLTLGALGLNTAVTCKDLKPILSALNALGLNTAAAYLKDLKPILDALNPGTTDQMDNSTFNLVFAGLSVSYLSYVIAKTYLFKGPVWKTDCDYKEVNTGYYKDGKQYDFGTITFDNELKYIGNWGGKDDEGCLYVNGRFAFFGKCQEPSWRKGIEFIGSGTIRIGEHSLTQNRDCCFKGFQKSDNNWCEIVEMPGCHYSQSKITDVNKINELETEAKRLGRKALSFRIYNTWRSIW